jgi:hypothetical protein
VNAARALARAEAVGVRLHLRPDGRIQMHAAAPPPADVLADLRRWREEVGYLLALRRAGAAEPLAEPPRSQAVAARAAALLRFAEEAFAALAGREPGPIEEDEHAAVFGVGADGASGHAMAVTENNFVGKGTTP